MVAALTLLAAAAPLSAGVNTVFNCPSSGISGNNDFVDDAFFVTNLAAVNIHSVTLFYSAGTDGSYSISLTASRNSYSGAILGTVNQVVTLAPGTLTPVTFGFGDTAFTSGETIAFTQSFSGPGNLFYNITPPDNCPNDVETVGTSSTSNGFAAAVQITDNTSSGGGGCVANATTLCIDNETGDKRFQITATYSTSEDGGRSGSGGAISLTPVNITEGGIFWFFSPANPEMLIKVLNGCATDQKFWVFYAAMTNVGFTVTVKDTKTNVTKTYHNPDLTAAPPVQDTAAFACP
jgi:hypothetical protein